MRRKVLFGFVAVIGGVALLLNPAPAEPPVRDLPQRVAKRGAGWCCPLYKIADHGSYQTWYAEKCFGQFCPLDTTKGGPGSCQNPDPNICVSLTGLTATAAAPGPIGEMRYHPDLRKGITPAAPKFDYLAPEGKAFAAKAREPVLVLVETKAGQPDREKAVVALFLTIAAPLGATPHLVATGLEVRAFNPTLDGTIPHSQVGPVDGKVCQVKYGAIVYQVVLDSLRADGDPADGRPVAAQMGLKLKKP